MISFGASALLGYRSGTLNIEKTREVTLIPGEANTRSLKMLTVSQKEGDILQVSFLFSERYYEFPSCY